MITATELARSFKTKSGPVEAVRGVDLEVRAGEIVGLLGPNGAGKTTTLRMLTTLLMPTSGGATVAGFDLVSHPREVRRHIGYVAQVGAAPGAGTRVGEELITQARLQGMSKATATARLAEVAPSLDLGGLEGRALLELSGGQRRRFDIALGLMHSPKLVFLDEPTAGLDPQSRANLWSHIRSLRDEGGVTILLTTHYLDEADALADRILVMDHGRIVADDTPQALKAHIAGDVIVTEFAHADAASRAAAVAGDPSAGLVTRDVACADRTLRVTVEDGSVAVAPLVLALQRAGLEPTAITVERPSLDDVFLTLTGHELRESGAASGAARAVGGEPLEAAAASSDPSSPS